MIVADTNVLLYHYTSADFGKLTAALLMQDADWHAPLLWRSEFRNGLATFMRAGYLSVKQSALHFEHAALFMQGREHEPDAARVLELAAQSGCTAYDCEYVDIAERLAAPLITADKKLIRAFPGICRPLQS